MTHEDLRKRWTEANGRIDELLKQPNHQTGDRSEQERLEWREAQAQFEGVVAECLGADATLCEACRTPIFSGDLYHAGVDPLCLECAPTYQSMIDEPEGFVDLVDESPSDPDDLRAAFDAHIAAGGSPDDKMVEVYD